MTKPGTQSLYAIALAALIALPVAPGVSSPRGAEGVHQTAAASMLVPVIDRPEMRSFQPYSGLQYGFRPTSPIKRGVKSKRPRIVMPKRVAPLIENGRATPYSAHGYAYCADPPGDFEPRTGPYDSRPIERRQCP
jgi:hypothetical protein